VLCCADLTWCGVLGAREKRLNTGEPVLDVNTVLLHQQREMQRMRAEVRNVTGLLNELMQRLAVSDSAKVRLQSHVWQSGSRNLDRLLGTAIAIMVPYFVRKGSSYGPLSQVNFFTKPIAVNFAVV